MNSWVTPAQFFQLMKLRQGDFWVHFCFISCFPSVSCKNHSPSQKNLICSPSCLYTDNQILVLELFAMVVARNASWLKMRWDIAGCLDLPLCLTYPALEWHGKRYRRTECRCCHSLSSSLSFFPLSIEGT